MRPQLRSDGPRWLGLTTCGSYRRRANERTKDHVERFYEFGGMDSVHLAPAFPLELSYIEYSTYSLNIQ